MKRFVILLTLFALCACTEPFDTGKESISERYLVIEAVLTDLPEPQVIKLSTSIPFNGTDEDHPVSNAQVTVSEGDHQYVFAENPETPGSYVAPADFYTESGKTYFLEVNALGKSYTATSTMPVFGFEIEKIDYKYTPNLGENNWTLFIWGKNSSGNFYLGNAAINGVTHPLEYAVPLDDQYFGGATIENFPIWIFSQTEDKQESLGDLGKPLKTGDVVSLVIQNLDKDTYDYLYAFSSNVSSINIPILSSKPANLTSNIKGDYALGYFAVCPTRYASCIIDDPYRTEFLDTTQQNE